MKIGIVGLGLIGGSLALDLTTLGYDVVGVSRQLITCEKAVSKSIVRVASTDFEILAKTDLIFICTPIGLILSTLNKIIPYLSQSTIITDVASVKTPIVSAATELWPNFVGSHPMAGTANQGIEAAQWNLFQNAPCVVTPLKNTLLNAIDIVTEMWRSLGCKIYNTTPEIHDQAVAWISHLPVIISANLIESCVKNKDKEVVKLAQNLASSGFRDTSRVGGGNVELGLMMAQYNRDCLLNSLKEYQQNFNQIIDDIEQEKWHNLENILKNSQKQRSKFMD